MRRVARVRPRLVLYRRRWPREVLAVRRRVRHSGERGVEGRAGERVARGLSVRLLAHPRHRLQRVSLQPPPASLYAVAVHRRTAAGDDGDGGRRLRTHERTRVLPKITPARYDVQF